MSMLLEVKLPYETLYPFDGRLVGWSVCHNFLTRLKAFNFLISCMTQDFHFLYATFL